MTSIAGYDLNATPCCGATYRTLRYRSMNFMAWEYWTDGYRDGSLMPNDQGLSKCKCGNFYLRSELQWLSQIEESDVPYTMDVMPDELPQAVSQARTTAIEIAARLSYWQHLNHEYRDRYRAHRDAEEAATEAAWHVANPDRRNWWQKYRKVPPPKYVMAADRAFTYPTFELSETQRENLSALVRTQEKNVRKLDSLTRAEIYREQGQFEEASLALNELPEHDSNVTRRLMARLIKEKVNAPMRYWM